MTTGLVRGMKLEQACDAVRDKAIEMLEQGGGELGFWTETGNGSVLVGVARRGQAAATMLIDRGEYSGMKLLEILTGA